MRMKEINTKVQIKNMKTNKAEEKNMERENLKGLRQLWTEEEGMGTVEVILIIVVLVGLVLIFRKQLTALVNSLFSKITKEAESI